MATAAPTTHTEPHTGYEDEVEYHVRDGGDDHDGERAGGISLRSQERARGVQQEETNRSQGDHFEVCSRLGERRVRNVHEQEDGACERRSCQGYRRRAQQGDPERCDESAPLPLLIAGAYAVADRDGAARHEPYGYRADDEDDGGGVADRDEPRLADDAHIDKLVDVLEEVRRDERGGECGQALRGAPFQKRWRMICGF